MINLLNLKCFRVFKNGVQIEIKLFINDIQSVKIIYDGLNQKINRNDLQINGKKTELLAYKSYHQIVEEKVN